MDFDLPKDLADYLDRARRVHRAGDQAARAGRTTTSASSTTAGRTPAPTGTAAGCPTTSGRPCSARPAGWPTPPATTATPSPQEYGGKDGTNLGMAVIREHLAAKGLGLHCDLQNEHAIVGNNVGLLLMIEYGTDAAEGRVDRRPGRGTPRLRLRHHRARARLRRHLHGDPRRARRRRVGHQRREDVEHRHPHGPVRPDLRPHQRQAG